MTTLTKYRQENNYIIAGVVNEDNQVIAFTIADKNLERYTTEDFETANYAFEWAESNYKALV